MALTRRYCVTGLLAAPALLSLARRAAAAAVDVAGPEDLAAALRQAAPGSRLRLAPGEYGALAMKGLGSRSGAPVTLAAADPGRPPRLARMDLREASNLVLEGLHFEYRFARDDAKKIRPFQIVDSRGVTVADCRFDGDLARGVSAVDDGHGFGFGLTVRGTAGFRLTGTTFRDFFNGLHVNRSRDITVAGNEIRAMRMDGMKFAEVQDVRIEGNYIHDFNRSLDSEDHADMIQFWTNKTKAPSANVVIRGNLLSSGKGWFTQSIFMRNEEVDTGRAGREMFYRNILIEENAILNAHLHGITVGEADGLTIRNNTIVRNAGSQGARPNPNLWTPRINVAEISRDVTITGNVVARIEGWEGQSGWRVAENFTVQDRSKTEAGYYAAVFAGDPADPAGFAYRKGGPLDGAGIGARRFQR